MLDTIECIENLDKIFEDVKFTVNSYVRLKVLATLFEQPRNMKDLTDATEFSYSAVSSIIHDLENKKWVYRYQNKYFLTNSTELRVGNIFEMDGILVLLDEFFNILYGHMVDMIPTESILELQMLQNAVLMESSGVDAYRTYQFIQNSLSNAECVRCIMPIFYEPFFEIFADLISDEKDVEIYVPQNLINTFERKSGIESLKPFDELDSFLLIITEYEMILGFFMDNGYFDQTRILTSKEEDCLNWAKNLYKNLKINEF